MVTIFWVPATKSSLLGALHYSKGPAKVISVTNQHIYILAIWNLSLVYKNIKLNFGNCCR